MSDASEHDTECAERVRRAYERERQALLAVAIAAKRVKAGLDRRITDGVECQPVFDGIAELDSALRALECER